MSEKILFTERVRHPDKQNVWIPMRQVVHAPRYQDVLEEEQVEEGPIRNYEIQNDNSVYFLGESNWWSKNLSEYDDKLMELYLQYTLINYQEAEYPVITSVPQNQNPDDNNIWEYPTVRVYQRGNQSYHLDADFFYDPTSARICDFIIHCFKQSDAEFYTLYIFGKENITLSQNLNTKITDIKYCLQEEWQNIQEFDPGIIYI